MRQQVEEIKGEQFALYDYFSAKFKLVKRNQSFNVKLPRMGYGLQYVVPIKNDFAAFGLVNKYNAPVTILKQTWNSKTITFELYEGGSFKAYSTIRPRTILLNKKNYDFSYTDNAISVEMPVSLKRPTLQLIL